MQGWTQERTVSAGSSKTTKARRSTSNSPAARISNTAARFSGASFTSPPTKMRPTSACLSPRRGQSRARQLEGNHPASRTAFCKGAGIVERKNSGPVRTQRQLATQALRSRGQAARRIALPGIGSFSRPWADDTTAKKSSSDSSPLPCRPRCTRSTSNLAQNFAVGQGRHALHRSLRL